MPGRAGMIRRKLSTIPELLHEGFDSLAGYTSTERKISQRKLSRAKQFPNDADNLLIDGSVSSSESDDDEGISDGRSRRETFRDFLLRQYKNIVHFFVEDWFLSGMLGVITAILSISTDVGIEYFQHFKSEFYRRFAEVGPASGFAAWVLFMVVMIALAGLICHFVSKEAVGSGIPEIKVIMHGFEMKNYLSLRTLVAKVIGLTLTLGCAFPVGKEGPFVHMGAIVASLLNKATRACTYNAFFSNEGRIMEMLSSGCAVGIACTFSAPAGGVLYGIESTSKYFAIKNYWRSFFATTCSAIVFRVAMNFINSKHISLPFSTIMAYYQTYFPNEAFLIEELPFFALLGVICGLLAAGFIWLNRQMALLPTRNRRLNSWYNKNKILYTVLWTVIVAVITFPDGFGAWNAGHLTFRTALNDFFSNCTFVLHNDTQNGCDESVVRHWTRLGSTTEYDMLLTLLLYLVAHFFMVSVCITLFVPSGVFVPSFVVGAALGRFMGEVISMWWPDGLRADSATRITPGLYAVVGAAAYTGAVTHSLSVAVIVSETTGQLCALLPVLLALMIANAICSFMQPSIYESVIKIKNLPYLADLPPSRISVHKLRVEKIMVKDIVFITKSTTYGELSLILENTKNLKSYPFVTDKESMTLLGSVSRRYLDRLLLRKLPNRQFTKKRRSLIASELLQTLGNSFRKPNARRPGAERNSSSNLLSTGRGSFSGATNRNSWAGPTLTDRNVSGNTLLANSPLHESGDQRALTNLLHTMNNQPQESHPLSKVEEAVILGSPIDLDGVAIDPAPFQLVKGTTLYKVHTLFSLLALNHAYVTHRGRLLGVVAVKELREALADIYTRGAVAPLRRNGPSIMSLQHPILPAEEPLIPRDDRSGSIPSDKLPYDQSLSDESPDDILDSSKHVQIEEPRSPLDPER